ncbi:MAG: NHL repeat-containing protein [Thermoanaerobaculia bacterium]
MLERLIFLISVPFLLFGNQNPVIDSFTADKYSVLPNSSVNLQLQAHDPDCASTCTSGCGQYIRADLTSWSSTGGSFISINNGNSSSPYFAYSTWQAPSVEGVYTINVQIGDSGSFLCGGRLNASASLQINVSNNLNNPPVISSLMLEKNPLLILTSTKVYASSYDPDGDSIIYEFSTDYGLISPISEGVAEYFAPENPGFANILCKVTDSKGAYTTKSVRVYITSLYPEKSISLDSSENYRISMDNYGYIFVPERKKFIKILNYNTGEVVKVLNFEGIVAVFALENGNLFVSTERTLKVISRDGRTIIDFNVPTWVDGIKDIFFDKENRKYLCLSSKQGKILIFNENGQFENSFGGTGSEEFNFKTASGLFVHNNEIYAGDMGRGKIKVFDYNGNYKRSYGSRGSSDGQFSQLNSFALSSQGNLYAVDTLKSSIISFSQAGNLREISGNYGEGLGEFIQPTSISINSNFGKILILNTGKNKMEVFTFASNSSPPVNNIPSTPEPISPLEGSLIPKGSNISLISSKSYDPDFQSLYYSFELYELKNNKNELLASWFFESNEEEVSVDATSFLQKAGSYSWRVRAYDLKDWSPWSQSQNFQISTGVPNNPPSTPSILSPLPGEEINTLEPYLTIYNSQDREGDPIKYYFEVYLHNGFSNYLLAFQSDAVPQGSDGTTSIKVPAGILQESQEVFWRVRASDGYSFSSFTNFSSFITPPFGMPLKEEVGSFYGADQTRPYFVNFKVEPFSSNLNIYYQIYGNFNEGDIKLVINDNYEHNLPAFSSNTWSFTKMITVPSSELFVDRENKLSFKNFTNKEFGIRFVTLNPPGRINLKAHSYNTVIDLAIEPFSKKAGDSIDIYKKVGEFGQYQYFTTVENYGILRDTGLQNGVVYFYFAVLKDLEGFEGLPSDVVLGMPFAGSTTPITDLILVKERNDVVLKWKSITNEPPIQHYEIYRDNFSNFHPDTVNLTNLLTTVNPYLESFKDSGALISNENIWYSIIPIDLNGQRGLE